MHGYGSDRVRNSGANVYVQSASPKGWIPRSPRTATSAEHPGTAVLWDDEIFEVLKAEGSQAGGVTYLLAPWREDHAIRQLVRYDEESEAALATEAAAVRRQHRNRAGARVSAVVLGNLPAPVQLHLASELGISAPSMTLLSAAPPVVLLGVCAWRFAGAAIAEKPSPVPVWLWMVAVLLVMDSLIRLYSVMLQSRPMGSIPGTLLYSLLWAVAPARWGLVSPFAIRGERLFATAVPVETARRDAARVRAPLLTLLDPRDQRLLAASCGFDYRATAVPTAWVILVISLAGVASMWSRAFGQHSVVAIASLLLAAIVAADQVRRLFALRQGPAGSLFAPLLRRFARDLLEGR